MEDENLKALFSNFQPRLSSSADFMERLQKNMEMAEALRQYTVTLRRHNRLALIIAAACGFACGVLAMLLLNPLVSLLSEISLSLPYLPIASVSIDTGFISWILIAAASILSAIHAYDLAISRLTPKISLKK